MLPQLKSKIYLAKERGLTESEEFRSYKTFNSGNYYNPHKQPFGALNIFNDQILAGGKCLGILAQIDSVIIIIPEVGAVAINDGNGHDTLVEAGQAWQFAPAEICFITLTNPYENELISFIQMEISQTPWDEVSGPQTVSFELDKNRNRLVKLFREGNLENLKTAGAGELHIGKFTGRQEVMYKVAKPGNGLFIYVILGAFEAQYRLLESGDGLALWDAEEIEIEALSEDAIILLLETPML